MFFLSGLILLLAGGSWFSGASTVGTILMCAGLVEVGVIVTALTKFFKS